MALPFDSTPQHESSHNVDDQSPAKVPLPSSPSPVGSGQDTPNSTSNQPSLLSSTRPEPHSTGNAPTIAAPHPKRFSAVNVTKKFLSKEPPVLGPAAAPSSLVATKSNGPQSRSPANQTATSRSRLFTTKLTPGSSAPLPNGGSWSRPSSTTPSSQPSGTTQSADKASNAGGPFGSQNGKLIQPQLRPSSLTKERQSSSSPVWGNRKNAQTANPSLTSNADFPTAAEAVQEVAAKKLKRSTQEVHDTTPETSALQQARIDEADTFRGVHLDPNAHHWDEMEEDDDNFLGGVVEFGDGKQYMVAPTSSPPTPPRELSDDRPPTPGNDEPVSKEERFGSDIGRHWPHASPATSQHRQSTSPASTSVSLKSPQDANRHLFNERSNRLEPYSGQHRTTSFSHRRESHGDNDGPRPAMTMKLESGPTVTQSASREQGRRMSRHGEGYTNERGRRLSNMGPPPPPFQHSPGGSVRQLPPHLSQQAPASHERERRMSSRESHRSRASLPSSSPQLGRDEPWLNTKRANQITSPALSFSSNLPATADSPLLSLPPNTDLNNLSKDYMHSAAERAKQRRQKEEEEREAQRERARKKAAELEARFGLTSKSASQKDEDAASAPTVTEDKVNTVIAEAISSAGPSKAPSSYSPTSSTLPRAPSLRGTHRRVSTTDPPQAHIRRTSITGDTKPEEIPTPADKVDSWRRSTPLYPPPAPATQLSKEPEKAPSPSPPFPSSVFILDEKPDEELEVVDFAELDRFVGISEPETALDTSKSESVTGGKSASLRPVASDFFEDKPTEAEVFKSASGSWRKPTDPITSDYSRPHDHSARWSAQPNGPVSHSTSHTRTQRPANFYKEAKLSTIDDTMSRIRGALHNMHEPRGARKPFSSRLEQQKSGHSSHDDFDEEHREVFEVSAVEPPRSPPPAWQAFVVSLGTYGEPLEPVNKKQLMNSERFHSLRWDIMSFDPPVEGMNKRDLSLNDVLFRNQAFKGKYKYRVSLPRTSSLPAPLRAGPRVNLPTIGAFGKPKKVAEPTSWRRQEVTLPESSTDVEVIAKLATTSCSPPPDTQDLLPIQKPLPPTTVPNASTAPTGTDSQVTTIRDSETAHVSKTNGDSTMPKSVAGLHASLSSEKSQPSSPFSAASGKVESTSSDDSTDRPITPPQRHTTTWAKSPLAFTTIESPVAVQQGPEAEHIKAVWLQTPEKPHAPVSNSLEGIGDDLTALPFTIQEVKSEDGETPPPIQPNTRMAFDMKRAFQQVPTGESSNNPTTSRPLQPAPAPPAPHPRYPLYSYPMALPNSNPNARPTYGTYGPVMPPPSPAMYSHPGQMPMRMPVNGQPHYGQPIWMMQAPAMASPGGMMRPLPSPYSMPMMPFTPGTPVYALPPPTLQNGSVPMNGTMAGRIPPSPIMHQQNAPPGPYGPSPSQHQSTGVYAPPPALPSRGQRSASGQSFQSNPGFVNNNTWRN